MPNYIVSFEKTRPWCFYFSMKTSCGYSPKDLAKHFYSVHLNKIQFCGEMRKKHVWICILLLYGALGTQWICKTDDIPWSDCKYTNWSKSITRTYLYNFDPLKPHFYIVKLGFTGVYIIFLISAQNVDCGYSLELPRWGGFNEYPQSMFCAEIWKISEFFIWKVSVFFEIKFSIYLNRRVFVMLYICIPSAKPYSPKVYRHLISLPYFLLPDDVSKILQDW